MAKLVDDEFIRCALEAHDDGEISTERLLNLVADTCGITVNEVCESLERTHVEGKDHE